MAIKKLLLYNICFIIGESMLYYTSKSEFHRQTNQWAKTIIEKTTKGLDTMDIEHGKYK